MIYVSGIDYESFNDAPGVNTVIYISGCLHNCPGCHNPETHDFKYGVPLTEELMDSINQEIDKKPYLNGVVLSGGDAMYSAKELIYWIDKLHIPKNNLTCFSGFTLEEILEDSDMRNLLNRCNRLIDGLFKKELRDTTLKFRGSSNQRIWIKGENNKWNKENENQSIQ